MTSQVLAKAVDAETTSEAQRLRPSCFGDSEGPDRHWARERKLPAAQQGTEGRPGAAWEPRTPHGFWGLALWSSVAGPSASFLLQPRGWSPTCGDGAPAGSNGVPATSSQNVTAQLTLEQRGFELRLFPIQSFWKILENLLQVCLPRDFLSNVFFPPAHFAGRIQRVTHRTHKICVHAPGCDRRGLGPDSRR